MAVGDTSGVLQCFSLKCSDVVAAFKTLPSGSAITHVTLGKGQTQRDKIFVASGHTVGFVHCRHHHVPAACKPVHC